MKNCFYSFLILFMLTIACAPNAHAQNITADAKLDQTTIRIGEQTNLRLIVHQSKTDKVNFPKLADTIIGKVQIVSNRMDTVVDKSDPKQVTVSQVYTITSFDQGTYNIPSFNVGSGTGVLTTPPLTLMVQTVQVDTTKAIYDIKQPMAVSYTFIDWIKDHWVWILLAIVIIGSAIGAFLYFKKRPKAEKPVVEVKPAIPPHILALNKLQQLRDKKLWQNDAVKDYYIELSDILREYLEQRYVIKTHEKTTDEIFASLRYMEIANDEREKLRQVLVLSDLVKFAKERPLPVDNELTMEQAVAFVNQTQQTYTPVQPTEGGSQRV